MYTEVAFSYAYVKIFCAAGVEEASQRLVKLKEALKEEKRALRYLQAQAAETRAERAARLLVQLFPVSVRSHISYILWCSAH